MAPRDAPDSEFLSAQAWECLAARLSFSARELEIARAILDDKKELAIARQLGISPHTVHTHLERLYHKLGVTSRVELVVHIARRHLELVSQTDSPLPPLCGNRAAGRCPLDG